MNLNSLVNDMREKKDVTDSKMAHIDEVYTKLAKKDTTLTKVQIAYMLYGPAGLELMGVTPEEYNYTDTPMGKGLVFKENK